jgi:hypothetical protein
MANARKMKPLHEMYSQGEIERATAYVERLSKNKPEDIEDDRLEGWADFADCSDPTKLIEAAVRAVLARRWYAVNGPQDPDLQPLPLGWSERRDIPRCGVGTIRAWFARSLAHLDYDVTQHPSFYDYACGIMAFEREGYSRLAELKDRFPPRLLPGLDRQTADWSPTHDVDSKTK